MWVVFALAASLFWGLSYVISEQVYKHISVLSSLALSTLVCGAIMVVVSLATGNLTKDLATVFTNPKVFWLVLAGILILTIAELFIGFSIAGKNATVAGLIEISYPLFIALFSYIIFKEANFNVATALGAALIFTGIGTIYVFNR